MWIKQDFDAHLSSSETMEAEPEMLVVNGEGEHKKANNRQGIQLAVEICESI